MMDETSAPTDADWAAALGPSMPAADFQAEALGYTPPGVGAPASSVSTVEPSADPWPPVPGDAFGPPAQLAAPPVPPPVANPNIGTNVPITPTIPAPKHGQLSQTVRQVTPAPGEAEAIERARLSARDAAGADADVLRAKAAESEAAAQAKDDQSVQLRLDQQEAEDKQAELEAREAAAREKFDKAQQDVANFKFHEYGSDKSLGDRLIGKIAVALGTFNLSGNHPHNEAAEKLQREVDRDFDRQKLDLMSKENIAKWRREGVTDASAKMKEEMGALYTRQAKFHEAIAAKATAMAIRAGIPVEEAQANALVKKNIAAADAANAKALEAFRGSVSTTYANPPKTGSGDGGGSAGAVAAISQYIKDHPKDQPGAYALAEKLGYKGKKGVDIVDKLQNDYKTAGEASEARAVRDPDTGKPIGLAPSPRVVDKIADQIAATRAYQRKVEELADHIDKHGRLLNPLSAEYKVRQSLAADVQAQGRQVSGLQASDQGQKLEHELIGGSGTGVEKMPDTKRLRELAHEASKRMEQHLRSTLEPIEGGAGISAAAGGAAASPYPPGTPSATNAKGEKVYYVNGKWTAP
jgi:hypothetical protein